MVEPAAYDSAEHIHVPDVVACLHALQALGKCRPAQLCRTISAA
jgi:hypothetical protein